MQLVSIVIRTSFRLMERSWRFIAFSVHRPDLAGRFLPKPIASNLCSSQLALQRQHSLQNELYCLREPDWWFRLDWRSLGFRRSSKSGCPSQFALPRSDAAFPRNLQKVSGSPWGPRLISAVQQPTSGVSRQKVARSLSYPEVLDQELFQSDLHLESR